MGALGLFIDGRKRIENLVEVDWKDYVEQAFLNVVIRRARCDHLIRSRRSQSKHSEHNVNLSQLNVVELVFPTQKKICVVK